ncbi:RNase H domain-containing protein [Trichonephila clavipes]|nr:RNase H domain-containing protein [Trichonephila clavipes]
MFGIGGKRPTLGLRFLEKQTYQSIESVIKRKCEVGAFSDDIVLWKSDSDLTKLDRDINLVLEDIRKFALDHKLTFNPTKSMVGFFTANRKLYNFQPNIFLYNQPLTNDKHPKYLSFVLDPKVLRNNIDKIVFKARKHLNILKYISGRDWGADACTQKNTYISLIRSILDTAWIITGLKNTCLGDIVLFKVDLQPLSIRRRACLTKYYNKLRSLDSRNRTSAYFKDWCNNQRLRRNSPFSQMVSFDLIIGAVEPHHLSQYLDPADDFDGVFFHPELPVHAIKQADLSAYLKQLALERIGYIPIDAVQVYADDSRDDYYRSGSGIYIKTQNHILRIQTVARFFTWIPSHIDLEGNEIADALAKAGACEVPEQSAPLTFLEIFTRTEYQNKTAWVASPPRAPCSHIKTMKFSEGCKSFEMCTNCSSEPVTPAHILGCLGLTKQDLADDPLLVLDFLKVYDVMDLV